MQSQPRNRVVRIGPEDLLLWLDVSRRHHNDDGGHFDLIDWTEVKRAVVHPIVLRVTLNLRDFHHAVTQGLAVIGKLSSTSSFDRGSLADDTEVRAFDLHDVGVSGVLHLRAYNTWCENMYSTAMLAMSSKLVARKHLLGPKNEEDHQKVPKCRHKR